MNTNLSELSKTAHEAPQTSGVYIWRDQEGVILYVGKAKKLKNRLCSYFLAKRDVKTRILVSRAHSIEYITTASEYDALILENTLIKQHRPRYNIALKDDKSYPVLRVTNETFPRIFKTRRIVQDGSVYFGPFPNAAALDTFIETLHRIYPLRRCSRLQKRQNPCMYYHIGCCAAPCCGKITAEDYATIIGEISRLLESGKEKTNGKTQSGADIFVEKIEKEMKQASAELNFEKAARLRDGSAALKMLHMHSIAEDFDPEARDYIGYAAEGPLASFTVLKMRSGKLVARDVYRTKTLNADDDLLAEFLLAYYTAPQLIPPRIFVPAEKGLKLTQRWFHQTFGVKPSICAVKKGMPSEKRHEACMNMTIHNAREDIARRLRERGDTPALEELRNLLALDNLPVRIEGFDIAHIGGKFPVASLISFYNGNPDKKNYRYFRLKTTDGIIDDFASMREASMRRYSRLLREQADLPDLILIDGGIGQVNAVKGVLDELSLDIPIIGLAKQDEEVYLPGNSTPISLPKRSDALRLLQRIRDETHRFATTRNQRLRTKENTSLVFEELPNVGKARARKLLDAFGSLDGLIAADVSAVYGAAHCSPRQAQTILDGARLLAESVAAKTTRIKIGSTANKTTRIASPQTENTEKPPVSSALIELAKQAGEIGTEVLPE